MGADERRAAAAARLAGVPALAAAGEKFYALVRSHAAASDVAALTAGLLVDIAVERAARRESERLKKLTGQ